MRSHSKSKYLKKQMNFFTLRRMPFPVFSCILKKAVLTLVDELKPLHTRLLFGSLRTIANHNNVLTIY